MARILLVDPDENLCRLYQMELAREGLEIVVAHDVKTAIQMSREARPDLVVMEINLHEQSEALERMAKTLIQSKSIPVIVNTSYGPQRENLAPLAPDAYVLKSADLRPLEEAIRRALHREQEAK